MRKYKNCTLPYPGNTFVKSTVTLAIACLLLFSPQVAVFGQVRRVLSTKDGLPQSFVSGLEQDKAGFVWIGTRNGLARYDGINFKVFHSDLSDSSVLASNLVVTVNTYHNDLWIEHESGEIDCLNPVSEKNVRYTFDSKMANSLFLRRAWIADSAKTIWRIIDGGGLVHYGKKTVFYNKKNSGFDSDTLWGLSEGKENLLWVLTRHGLSSLNRSSGKVINYGSPHPPDYHDYIHAVHMPLSLHQRTNGEFMWIDRKFVYFFSPSGKKFTRQIPLAGDSGRGVTFIRTGPDGADYFERNGVLYRYHDDTGLTPVHRLNLLSSDPIQSFLVDRSGLVWLGTNAHGIVQLDLTTPFFLSFPAKSGFAGDVFEKEFGITISDLFNWHAEDNRFAAPGYHLRSAYDGQGAMWVGLKESVVKYDPVQKKFERLPRVTHVSNPLEKGIGIKGLTISGDGAPVVIGYNRNVLIYNSRSGKWDWLIPEGTITRQFGNQITPQDILMDNERIWITTEKNGLLFIDRKTGKINQLKREDTLSKLPSNQLLGMVTDPSRPHLLWIGSYNGLICLNKQTLAITVFNVDQGLPDNTIYSLVADHYGSLWFGTNKGLCRFSPITHKVRIFQTRHGLVEDEFNRFHQLKLPDRRLAFGGTEGWTIFDPDKIKEDTFQPAVALTGLKINNIDVGEWANGLFDGPFNAAKQLSLPYDQNTLTVSFAGLQFNQPRDLQYRYKLKGYDQDWVASGHVPFANYTKIPPGHYELWINTSNTTGQWSKTIKKLKITIAPPWWRTWWAYLLYLLIVAGGIRYWLKLQLTRMELRKSVELKQQEAKQLRVLSEMKERFFNNVTHDFRTPLTLIISPLPALIRSHAGTPDEARLTSIKRNAEQLLALITQLLDFSRLDARMLKVEESAGDLVDFSANVLDLFREEALKKNISLHFSQSAQGHFWFDASKLERILTNLIGNALKFTPSGGKVSLSVTAEEEQIAFTVTDTGIGIPQNQIAFIFNRYHQVDTATSAPSETASQGSGIGLALVKELVVLQKGQVQVESIPGKGTKFHIRLPYRQVAPVSARIDLTPEPVDWNPAPLQGEEVRILIVEDHPEIAELIKQSLPESYVIDTAPDGASGLILARETIPDLIISDVMMPVMDGFEFCSNIKQHEHTNHIPVILLTAKVAVENRMEGLMKGADDYLLKPFHAPELYLRVHNLLERQRNLRARIQAEISVARPTEDPSETISIDPFLAKFHAVIEQQLDNSSLGVDDFASLMNMSRSQLHRKLRAIAGIATSEIVRNYRLTRSLDFLRSGYTSSESAYKSGFDSPAYFSKCFREFYGVTPSDFQKAGN